MLSLKRCGNYYALMYYYGNPVMDVTNPSSLRSRNIILGLVRSSIHYIIYIYIYTFMVCESNITLNINI